MEKVFNKLQYVQKKVKDKINNHNTLIKPFESSINTVKISKEKATMRYSTRKHKLDDDYIISIDTTNKPPSKKRKLKG